MKPKNIKTALTQLCNLIKNQWGECDTTKAIKSTPFTIPDITPFIEYLDHFEKAVPLSDDHIAQRVSFEKLTAFSKGANLAYFDTKFFDYAQRENLDVDFDALPEIPTLADSEHSEYFRGLAFQYRQLYLQDMITERRIRHKLHDIVVEIKKINKAKWDKAQLLTVEPTSLATKKIHSRQLQLLTELENIIDTSDTKYITIPEAGRICALSKDAFLDETTFEEIVRNEEKPKSPIKPKSPTKQRSLAIKKYLQRQLWNKECITPIRLKNKNYYPTGVIGKVLLEYFRDHYPNLDKDEISVRLSNIGKLYIAISDVRDKIRDKQKNN